MAHLNLYKGRKYNTVTLNNGDTYKFPNELTVEEQERLLERQEVFEAIKNQEVIDEYKEKQVDRLYKSAFDKLEIIFQHYQPEMTDDDLRELTTPNEALELLGFFNEYRHREMVRQVEEVEEEVEETGKKKLKTAKSQLRELRRVITLLVSHGFALSEVRQLYLDELDEYYKELFYNLEHAGKVKEGTYDKIVNRTESVGETPADKLRKQFFGGIKKKYNG